MATLLRQDGYNYHDIDWEWSKLFVLNTCHHTIKRLFYEAFQETFKTEFETMNFFNSQYLELLV